MFKKNFTTAKFREESKNYDMDLKDAPPCLYGNNIHTRITPKNRGELALQRKSLK